MQAEFGMALKPLRIFRVGTIQLISLNWEVLIMESLQNVTWIFVGAGVILVSTAVLGGGIEVKEIKIPKLNTHVRFLAAILGVVFIMLPVILTELPIKPREENLIATPTKPENKEETGKTITVPEQPSEPNKHAKDDRKAGFIQLFNGKNLNGWKANNDENAFTASDGMIVAQHAPGYLFYVGHVEDANFKNFEFEADIKTEPGANGGVFFHTTYQENDLPSKGYEAQIDNTGGDWRKTGSLWDVNNVSESLAKDNEWFRLNVTVRDKRIIIKVNGKTTVDYIEPEYFYDPDRPNRRLSSGTFALQTIRPGSAVYYKNIMVKPLLSETGVSDTRKEAKDFLSDWMSALKREDVETMVQLSPPPLFVNMKLITSASDIREMYLGYYENDGPLREHGQPSMDRKTSVTIREYIDLGHLEEDDPILSQMSLDDDDIVVTMIGHYEDGTEVRASFYFLRLDGHVKMAGFRQDFPPLNEAREYKEDFEDGKAQGWNLKWNSERQEGWRIVREGGNYMLSGTARGAIRYAGRSWQNSRVRFQVRMEKEGKEGGCLHLSYRDSNESRYLINFQAERVQLEKIVRGTIYGNLAGSPPHMRHRYNTWYSVEVKGEGPRIRIYVNGELGVDYPDPEPLLSGNIVFWVGNGSVAQVDDIFIEPLK
jgi:hypothetical protein